MKRTLALLLALLMMAGLLAGCGGGGDEEVTSGPTGTPDGTSAAPSFAPQDTNEPDEVELPLTEDEVTFTYWLYNGNSFEDFASYDDNLFYQWMEDQTGVHLEFKHPPVGGQNENFQTMILSQDYTDFIHSFKSYYSGGVDKGIEDGVIVALNDAVDQWMPHYRAEVYRDEETFIRCVSDAGNLWGVHHIVDKAQDGWWGPYVRLDWLDRAGMTLDDIKYMDGVENMLTQFKEYTYENEGPFQPGANGFSYAGLGHAAYGVTSVNVGGGIINIDGKAAYSPTQPGFKDYVGLVADWYAKGLVNKNFIVDANNMGGPEDRWVNSEIGYAEAIYTCTDLYAASASTSDLQPEPDFHMVAVPTPLKDENQSYSDIHIRQTNECVRNGNSMAISTHCDNLELACRYWDYAWTDEGKTASNWGPVVGEKGDTNATYYIDEEDSNNDGYKEVYQPWLMEKYNQVSYVQTKVAVHNGPTYSMPRREFCTMSEEMRAAPEIWGVVGGDYIWPEGVTLTKDEGDEASGIVANCQTAVNEWTVAVITGEKSVDTYETELVPKLESMNWQRAIELYQQALDRLNARKQYME